MAELDIASCACGVFAANQQRAIIKTRNEDDAPILLHAQFVWASCVIFDVPPLCLPDLAVIEEFVVSANSDLVLTVQRFVCE